MLNFLSRHTCNRQFIIHNRHVQLAHISNITSIVLTLKHIQSEFRSFRPSAFNFFWSRLSFNRTVRNDVGINAEFFTIFGSIVKSDLSRVLKFISSKFILPDNFAYSQDGLLPHLPSFPDSKCPGAIQWEHIY